MERRDDLTVARNGLSKPDIGAAVLHSSHGGAAPAPPFELIRSETVRGRTTELRNASELKPARRCLAADELEEADLDRRRRLLRRAKQGLRRPVDAAGLRWMQPPFELAGAAAGWCSRTQAATRTRSAPGYAREHEGRCRPGRRQRRAYRHKRASRCLARSRFVRRIERA
jgi:hypothetical protein